MIEFQGVKTYCKKISLIHIVNALTSSEDLLSVRLFNSKIVFVLHFKCFTSAKELQYDIKEILFQA